MADKGDGHRRPAPARQRIKTLTQAALNADVTVEQVDDLLTGLRETLTGLDTLDRAAWTPPWRLEHHPGPDRRSWHLALIGWSNRLESWSTGRAHRRDRRNDDGALAPPRTRYAER